MIKTAILAVAALTLVSTASFAESAYSTSTGKWTELPALNVPNGPHYEGGVNAGASDYRGTHNFSTSVSVQQNLAACCGGKAPNDRDEYGNMLTQ